MKISEIAENIQNSRKKVKAAYDIKQGDIKAILGSIHTLQQQNLQILTIIESQQIQIEALNKPKDRGTDYLGGLDFLNTLTGKKKY